jgi:hypothetical protein
MSATEKDLLVLTGFLMVMLALQWYFNGWRIAL